MDDQASGGREKGWSEKDWPEKDWHEEAPRIIASGQWEQDEYGDTTYIPDNVRPSTAELAEPPDAPRGHYYDRHRTTSVAPDPKHPTPYPTFVILWQAVSLRRRPGAPGCATARPCCTSLGPTTHGQSHHPSSLYLKKTKSPPLPSY